MQIAAIIAMSVGMTLVLALAIVAGPGAAGLFALACVIGLVIAFAVRVEGR